MNKRVYEIGEPIIMENKKINALIRAKEGLKILHGESYWKVLYKNICRAIRTGMKTPYLLSIQVNRDFYDKETICIHIFEHIADSITPFDCKYDEEKKMYYIEVEEN